jgi:(2R)-ethylmalonyl-CoA mutase
VVGGIIPDEDQPHLLNSGVAAVYTPKDYELSGIMTDICELASQHRIKQN